MDEADVLGDRIAIISNGKLVAHGTASFLKTKFGRGYYLTIAKKPMTTYEPRSLKNPSSKLVESLRKPEEDEEDVLDEIEKAQLKKEEAALNSLTNQHDIQIHQFIKSHIANATLVENIGLEMTYSISNKIEFTKNYENFFHEIELNMEQLAIDSIGISDTTLEEIFIKLAKEPKSNSFQPRQFVVFNVNFTNMKQKFKDLIGLAPTPVRLLTEDEINSYSAFTQLRVSSKFKLVQQQLSALLIKRVHRVKRNIKGFFAEIVLPVIFVCLALLVATLIPKLSDQPSLELHPWYYATSNQIFLSKTSNLNYERQGYNSETGINTHVDEKEREYILDQVEPVTSTFFNRSSIGTRCVTGYAIHISQQAQDYRRSMLDPVLKCEDYNYRLLQNYTLPDSQLIDELNAVNYTYMKQSPDCVCNTGFPKCSPGAGGDIDFRPVVKLRTNDILYELTSRNVSDWLIKTEFSDKFFRRRYGGYEFDKIQNKIVLDKGIFFNIEATLNNLLQTLNMSTGSILSRFIGDSNLIANQSVKIWFNPKGYDTSVSYLNVINNALLRSKLTDEHAIVAFNHPMNFTKTQFFDQIAQRVIIDLFVAICIIFALSFIPASFLVFLLEERENHSKRLQFVSGVKPYIYWISNFIWDMINYIVPCFLCILIFVIFNVEAYMSKENFPFLILLMLLYGWSCIPLMYPLNYLFKVPSTAFVSTSSLNVFIGIVTTMTTSILDQLSNVEPDLGRINQILKPIFLIFFPHYCLGQGFLKMSLLYNTAQAKRSFGLQASFDPFEYENGGRNLIALVLQGIVYFTLNMLIQYRFFIRFKPTNNLSKLDLPKVDTDDDDVANERERVLNNEENFKINKKFLRQRKKLNAGKFMNEENNLEEENDPVRSNEDYIKLINLTKVYKKVEGFKLKKHVAVNSLSLGINKGECFGLIGVNGAGKTTTFKMITGDIGITGGDVKVNDFSVSNQIEKVHSNLGYW